MELAAAEILWKRSQEECHMRYTTMLSDGDLKTFNHLQNLRIYRRVILEKEECLNHVSKRLFTALTDLVKNGKIQGITLGGKKSGALTNKVISLLSIYYRASVVRNYSNVNAMQKDILATLTHCSSTDSSPNHSKCPKSKDSWCFYNKAIAHGKVPPSHTTMRVVLKHTTVDYMKPIYILLTSTELLSRCTRGLTQNANEAVHSVIWRKCPRNTFVSGAKIEIAVANADAEFNMGHLETAKSVEVVTGESISEVSQKILQVRDRKRLLDSNRKSGADFKRARTTKKFEKRHINKKNLESEGSTYGAGQFI